ncbi:Uncharacterised protein [Mycobacteroides abscessus subsp. abscessus]|nr:Uncharacterised protein [Mycobacteroides abscessus subsp. abscessus]
MRETARAWGWGLLALGEAVVRGILLEIALFGSVIAVVLCLAAGQLPMKIAGAIFGCAVVATIVITRRKKLSVGHQWLIVITLIAMSVLVVALGWKLGLL